MKLKEAFFQTSNKCLLLENNYRLFSQAFEIVEQVKAELGVEKYTLTQTSLEQVFLNLTKYKSKTAESNEVVEVDEYLV